MTKQSAYVGGEAARDGSPLDGLGGRLDRWGPKPAPSEEAKDTAAAGQDADAEIDAELDAEDAARVANMRRLGLADPETAEKAPAATLASVEKELADVTARMKTARGAEFNALDRRQLELIQTRLDLQAGKAPATDAEGETEAAEDSTDEGAAELSPAETKLAKLQEELAAIRELRKTDAKAFAKEATQSRERELIAEIETVELGTYVGADIAGEVRDAWSGQGGVAANLVNVTGLVKSLQASGVGEAFGTEFDALPTAARLAVMQHFGVAGGSLSAKRAAVEKVLSGQDLAAVQRFWETWGAAVTKGLVR
jgi:hypothetical protein